MEAVSSLQFMQDIVNVHVPSVLLSTPFKNVLFLLDALILETHICIPSERHIQYFRFSPYKKFS